MKISVICTVYNHASFLQRTLEGFIGQQMKFPFCVFIGDDASTDGSADIIRAYAKKYPHIIRCVCREKNIGPMNNFIDLVARVQTPYVALCEGDDYWTDPLKLQKQVDFLDAHPECSVCFHPVKVTDEEQGVFSEFPTSRDRFHKDLLSLEDLQKRNFIPTNSVMYRWRFNDDSLDLIPDGILPGDWYLHLLHAQKGAIGFLPDAMGVYRKHRGSMWYDAGKKLQWFERVFRRFVKFYRTAGIQFKRDFGAQEGQLFLQFLQLSAQNGDFTFFEKIIAEEPFAWESCLKSARQLKNIYLSSWLGYKLAFRKTVRDNAHWQYQMVKSAKELLSLAKKYGYNK